MHLNPVHTLAQALVKIANIYELNNSYSMMHYIKLSFNNAKPKENQHILFKFLFTLIERQSP